MRVGVVDAGSNSVRLLIASVKRGRVREVARERVYLRLGDDIFHVGQVRPRKLDELELTAERFAQRARAARVERFQTIVTAPGRQSANAEELIDVLADATRAPVVVLTAEEEGHLAWEGAISTMNHPPECVGVVDLGGGSCEVALGRRATGPTWVCSRDAGALRVTRSFFPGPRATFAELEAARAGIRSLLDGVEPAHPNAALAVGGTARAVGKIVGPRFGAGKLDALAERLVRDGLQAVCESFDITPGRIETLLGGSLVLAELARRLDSKLEVGLGGLREGAALALSRVESAAA